LEINTIISSNVNVAMLFSAHSKSITVLSRETTTHIWARITVMDFRGESSEWVEIGCSDTACQIMAAIIYKYRCVEPPM
jgi:hypothetical protein